jgi:hypothetical protein
MLFFSQSDQAARTVHEIRIVNHSEEPATLRGAASDIPEFQTVEMKTIEPEKQFEVTVRLRPEAEPGRYSGNIRIVIDGPEGGTILIPLRADISR